MHLCAELIAAYMMLERLGEVGANFSLQLSSRTQFTKIKNKKVIAETQCEKHKKSSLMVSCFWFDEIGLRWSFAHIEGHRLQIPKYIVFLSWKILFFLNSVNPDEMQYYVTFHLSSHCLRKY